jgi:hypothetical protein
MCAFHSAPLVKKKRTNMIKMAKGARNYPVPGYFWESAAEEILFKTADCGCR